MTDQSVFCDDGPKCPYCGHVHSECEDWQGVVSFWGTEDKPKEYECGNCDLTFQVNEIVQRTWESLPQVQPAAHS